MKLFLNWAGLCISCTLAIFGLFFLVAGLYLGGFQAAGMGAVMLVFGCVYGYVTSGEIGKEIGRREAAKLVGGS